MAIAINSSFTASVPAAYGGSTPVIDLGLSPAAISTAVALTRAGSVVVSISGAPAGSVTYTAAGLLREISFAGVSGQRPPPQVVPQERKSSQAANSASADLPRNDGREPDQAQPAVDGVYNGSGVFTPTSGVSPQFAAVLRSDPGLSAVAIAANDSFASGVVGTLVSTSA
ncbi:hypothetical protein F506_13935 [Herbaspirillum hiltneri N3]|uniref:Uncharacterized protein n=1 Tax=Herbaspirillum hiltneri N3 TaxID=1262470 RepID=A0ABN4I009_9BURK|nr:hypothetical protein [Herbaspirillum hiltneri]AKZ63618.1 hypothetical protein F506_13935 [Herbaspirillum hiltneri N3]